MARRRTDSSLGCVGIILRCLFYCAIIYAVNHSDAIFNLIRFNSENTKSTDNKTPIILNYYYYNQLNDSEKEVYNAIYEQAKTGGLSIKLDPGCSAYVFRVYHALVFDHPELYWLNVNSEYIMNSSELTLDIKTREFWQYDSNKNQHYHDMWDEANKIVEKASAYSSEKEKAKFVHDYLITHVTYANEELAEREKTDHSPESDYIYTAYGCLVNGRCVCAGYAKAYALIMNQLGINCAYVWGEAGDKNNRGLHAWNCIEIDGANYFVDVTWDDGWYYDKNGKRVESDDPGYDYFLIDSATISKDHTIDVKEFKDPYYEGWN